MTRIEHITLTSCAPNPIECVCHVTTYPQDLRVQKAPEVSLKQIYAKGERGDVEINSQSDWMEYISKTQNGYLDHSTWGQISDECEHRINEL